MEMMPAICRTIDARPVFWLLRAWKEVRVSVNSHESGYNEFTL